MQIIVPHTNCDLDSLGAAVGAQVLYPSAVIVLPGAPGPLAGEFLSLHRYHVRVRHPSDIDLSAVTRAVVVDTADPSRLGPLREVVERADVHLFDHHPPGPDDLKASVVMRDIVGSTCTLVAELIRESGVALSPVQSTAMLLGIYADTGSLSLMNTTDRDAAAAAFLLARGANLRAVARFIQGALSPAQQALLHQLQNRSRPLRVRGAQVRLVEGETPEYVGGLNLVVHKLQEIMPGHALFAAVKMADRVHLVARSEVPWINAAKAMSAFGGGGHPAAASAQVKKAALVDVVARLEATLEQVADTPLVARDVMSSPVKTIMASKPAKEAERLMLRHGHSGMPVVDENGRLVGVVSLRDVEKARHHGLEHAPVKGMMNNRVVTVPPEMPLDEVQDLLVEKDIGRVPVVEEGNLVGIVTRSDLLGLVYGGLGPRWHRTLYEGPGGPGLGPVTGAGGELLGHAVERLPAPIHALFRTAGAVAQEAGVTVYAVGGFVRDLLIGRPNLDIDLVVEGDGIAYAQRLANALDGEVQEVPRFATAHIYLEKDVPGMPSRLDVATARREFYEHAAALPLVEHADLREDLYRRDFSINAMAIRLTPGGPGGLVDFFGGIADLEAGHIRILHSLSFVEDPTRIMRAVRFATRYGFQLEPSTAQCARSAVSEGFLQRVTIERLRNELLLILREPGSGASLALLQDLGIWERMLPGVPLDEVNLPLVDRVDQMELELPDLYAAADPRQAKLAVLLHGLPLPEGLRAVKRLKLKREVAQPLYHILTCQHIARDLAQSPHATPAEVVRVLGEWVPAGLMLLYLTGGGDIVLRYWRQWRHIRLEISGADLTQAGVPAGPRIGRALARVLADRLDGLAAERETQMRLALAYAQEED